MTVHFISDLHLHPKRPDIFRAFQDYMSRTAILADSLYILGDFFEYWIGDDSIDEFQQQVIDCLKAYTDTGRKLYFLPGNRDFLIGKGFARACNCTLLSDPQTIQLDSETVIISHGDGLCTTDENYMNFRRIVRNPIVQKTFLALPRFLRQRIARRLREDSKSMNQSKDYSLMDVAPEAVDQLLQQHSATTLVHGHTHRAKVHATGIADTQRIVLGDWDRKGWYLQHDAAGFKLQDFVIPAV
ncbi:UDP-2,3-diacylglucosamine diphosphatase [Spongorhabdus nitratireducens]